MRSARGTSTWNWRRVDFHLNAAASQACHLERTNPLSPPLPSCSHEFRNAREQATRSLRDQLQSTADLEVQINNLMDKYEQWFKETYEYAIRTRVAEWRLENPVGLPHRPTNIYWMLYEGVNARRSLQSPRSWSLLYSRWLQRAQRLHLDDQSLSMATNRTRNALHCGLKHGLKAATKLVATYLIWCMSCLDSVHLVLLLLAQCCCYCSRHI